MSDPWSRLGDLPQLQLLFLLLTVVTFTIGNNLISVFHCRRIGKEWRFFGNVFSELLNYNWKEWVAVAVVLAMTICFFAAALAAG